MKQELCVKVVEVQRKSNRVMTVVRAFEEDVVRIIRVYGPQSGRTSAEKSVFMLIGGMSGIFTALVSYY